MCDHLFRAVLADDPGNPVKLRNAALAQKYLGSHHERGGRFDKALTYYEAAITLDRQRLELGPTDPQAQLDYAISLGNIGNIQLRRGEIHEAIPSYRLSLEMREAIASADPQDVYAQGRVAFALTKLATLYSRTGRWSDARADAVRAVTILEPLVERHPSYRREYFGALKTLADIDAATGRQASACVTYRRARQLLTAMEPPVPNDVELIKNVDRMLETCAAAMHASR
jgi:tetratricopeptide (TPR) repeat protein